MTRKEKKQKRKAKRAPTKISSSLNGLAIEMSKLMTAQRPSSKLVNMKSYCEKCKQGFCLGFDNVEQFCIDCFYKNCCKKDTEFKRFCRNCS